MLQIEQQHLIVIGRDRNQQGVGGAVAACLVRVQGKVGVPGSSHVDASSLGTNGGAAVVWSQLQGRLVGGEHDAGQVGRGFV